MGRKPEQRWLALLALALCVSLFVAACGSDAGTSELGKGASDKDSGGPPPTAPRPTTDSAGKVGLSGSVDVNDLIQRIDALNNETNLCSLLTGQAMSDISTADINLTSLVADPAGFSALFSALDKVFAHMVQIGPPELTGPLQALQGVWKGLAASDPRSPDVQTKLNQEMSDPAVQAGQTAIENWVSTNCGGTSVIGKITTTTTKP